MKAVRLDLLLNLLAFVHVAVSDTEEILGCGGFVKSQYPLDHDKIEIKLFTKQGSLKLKTECAPNTGYYFIPLENKGEYILRISSLESGWSFEPSEYAIKFDGKTDLCSKGVDINFDFKGFGIRGTVTSLGFDKGPSGVKLELTGPNDLKLNTVTLEGGSFSFDSVPPGKYSLKATHPTLSFEKDLHTFEIKNQNVLLHKQISVSGYDVSGKVTSDKKGVEGVTLVLTSKNSNAPIPKGCGTVDKENVPSDIKDKILCSKKSEKSGVFTFGGVSPGSYSVIPVYKGQNTVYSVTPSHLNFELQHLSKQLTPNFEVEGFTVLGRVKGLSGASILIDGELKATSVHDGTFTIPKMKPGTYEFEVNAEKFQFDKVSLTISAASPVLPDFVPSRFLICGKIHVFPTSTEPQLTFSVQKTGSSNNQAIRQKIIDPNHFCIFLPEGSYTALIESVPEKFFIPEKYQLQVPSGSGFNFKEFTGNIKGTVTCKVANCDGSKVQVSSQQNGHLMQEITLINGQRDFKFENLASGIFSLRIINEKFCWKQEVIENVQLKNSDVDNIAFVQTGVPMEIESTHDTHVEVIGKNGASVKKLQITRGRPEKICLSDPATTPDSYSVKPSGCHEFEKTSYPFTVGTKISLVAKRHQYSFKVLSPGKISDLKLTRNKESFTVDQLQKSNVGVKVTETVKDVRNVEYEVSFLSEPKTTLEWQVFSYGFMFDPSEFKIDTGDDCKFAITLVIAKKSHVIQGKLTPPVEADIRIELIGDPESTTYVSSNSNGEYIAGPFVHSSGFRVIPELPGYNFRPLADDPYSFTVHQLAKIQVQVKTSAGGSPTPLSSVLLSLSGPNAYRHNKVTDSNGEIVFGDLQAGQYYLKALLKEFRFEPSAVNIDLHEQETKTISLKATRESFSLHGQLTALSGELLNNVLVSAKGIGNCSEYGEEGASDEHGNFRIWALKSYCTYEISLVKRDDFAEMVERTVPEKLEVKIGAEDVHNVSFVVITPVRRMDVSLRCYTNNPKSLDHLKVIVSSAKDPDRALHVVPFNGISYIILPPLPKDGNEYIIGFEANINKFQYQYKLPNSINFTAISAYAHFKIQFNMEPTPVDQEIGKNSYIAFCFVLLVVLMIANYERLGLYAKDMYENYTANSGGGVSLSKKTKSKTK